MSAAKKNFPASIGLIMDGNRRYARERGLPVFEGHEAGQKKLKEFMQWAKDAGITTVYAYAFSTENWERTKEEIGYLMRLLEKAIIAEANELIEEKIRIKFIGQLDRFSPKLQEAMRKLEADTKEFKHTLVLLLSYGGRAEILSAIKKIPRNELDDLTEKEFSKYLWTGGIPDPEMVLRTSGEVRTSNFLPWQSAYSEWFFTKTLWPAFTKQEFTEILSEFSKRERRNGK